MGLVKLIAPFVLTYIRDMTHLPIETIKNQ